MIFQVPGVVSCGASLGELVELPELTLTANMTRLV